LIRFIELELVEPRKPEILILRNVLGDEVEGFAGECETGFIQDIEVAEDIKGDLVREVLEGASRAR
jgi:hypothetical protein